MPKKTTEVIAIKQRNNSEDGLRNMLEKAKSKFAEVAPAWLKVDKIIRVALAARSQNPALRECSKESFLLFLMKMAETGLETIGPGGAWPVPFRNKYTGQKEVVFIPDWRGLVAVAKKSNAVKSVDAQVVYSNDTIRITLGVNPSLDHTPALKDRGEVIGAYAIVIDTDDRVHIEWMTRDEIEKVRRHSKAAEENIWTEWFERMALKTVVRRAMAPFAGASKQLSASIALDEELDFAAHAKEPEVKTEPTQQQEDQHEDELPFGDANTTAK